MVYFLADSQFAYAAGINGYMLREKPAACFYQGKFYAESLLLAETGNSIGAIQIAGTGSSSQIPFFVTACDYTLIGEEFLTASAEEIPIKTNSIDTVVCTYTLCSIPNPDIALSEISRVLKKDGKFLFTEHSKSPDDKVSKFQKRLAPIWKILGDGCHLTRDIRGILSDSGFNIDSTEDMYIPGTPKFIGYHVWGLIRK